MFLQRVSKRFCVKALNLDLDILIYLQQQQKVIEKVSGTQENTLLDSRALRGNKNFTLEFIAVFFRKFTQLSYDGVIMGKGERSRALASTCGVRL